MVNQIEVGDPVETYSHPGESFTVLALGGGGRTLQLRSADSREFWIGAAMVKPLAQEVVKD